MTSSATGFLGLLNGSGNNKVDQNQGVSLQAFLGSLAVAAIVFGVEIVLFVLLRKKLQRVYEPRTYLVPEK